MNIKHEDTVYIVSGFMRTGTSMMMKCLEAGGLEAISRESRDDMRKAYSDEHYDPNRGGLYELETKDFMASDFPEQYKGKLIKLLNAGTAKMKVMPKIRVVFMKRDSEEIRQSYEAFFGDVGRMKNDNIEKALESNLALLRNRRDVEVIDFWYRDVVENPQKHFEILKENGWPINVEKCVAEVDAELLRFKKENLTQGI